MAQQVKVETAAFNQMCRTLSRISAVPYKEVVRAEVGRILEKTLAETPSAKRDPIITRWAMAFFSAQPITLYLPRTREGGKARFNAKRVGKHKDKISYFLFNRYPDALWSQINNRRLASLEKKLKAIGLAKQSWLRLAQQLGVVIRSPKWVDRAIATSGKVYPENTSVRQEVSQAKIQIDIANAQPTVNLPTVGGRRALTAAIAGRVKYFEKNISLRVFNDQAKIARQYPGMKVVQHA